MTKRSPSFQRSTVLEILICFALLRVSWTRNYFSDLDLSSQTLKPEVTGFKMTGNVGNGQFGSAVRTAGDIDNDGYDDIIVGAFNMNTAYVIYGREESSFLDLDFSTTVLDPLTTGFMITGNTAGDNLGWSVSTAGDFDYDGFDDIIVAAYGKNSFQGAVYVIYGGPKSTMSNWDFSSGVALNPLTTGFMITGNAGNYLGTSVSAAGDINKDGYADIIVGAPRKNSNQGAAYVIYGRDKSAMSNIALSSTLDPALTGFMIIGEAAGDYFGDSVSTAGDINRDGFDDIIIGAAPKNSDRGAAYLIYGRAKSTMYHIDLSLITLDPTSTGFMITGETSGDLFGWPVSTAGDINNDGYDDIIIGADSRNSKRGAAYVIYGGNKPAMSNIVLSSTTLDPTSTGFMITGQAVNDYLGHSVGTAGDINNDGYNDIIVGVKSSNQGAAYVIYGGHKSTRSNIVLSSTTLDPLTTGFMITGNAAADNFGLSVNTAGDLNNDGYDDIIVGAPAKYSNRGVAYVIYASCLPNCKQCSSEPVCTECKASYRLYQSKCFATCPDTTFASSTTTCGDCSDHCNHCSSPSVCTECQSSYLMYQSKCFASCPEATLATSATTCEGQLVLSFNDLSLKDCPTNCKYCSSTSVCTECKSSYLLYKSQCFASCPDTTFANTATTCQDCSANCNHCSSSSVCTECKSSYLMYQSQCFASCPERTFAILPTTCQDCPANCNKCSSASVCTECQSSYRLYQDKCFSSCPDTTFANTATTCGDCPANCKKCSSASVCTECNDSYLMYQSKCFASCPDSTFANTLTTCADCPAYCKHCSSSSICTECQSSYLMCQSKCFASCPETTFANTATTCADCPTDCKHCSSASVCTECKNSYLMYQSKCFASCPDTTFANTAITCADCPAYCKHCSSASVCTECQSSYLMYQSQCFASCPDTTFASTTTKCEDCSMNCNHCISSSVCTECKNSYFLYKSECFDSCPDATLATSPTKCEDCPNNCNRCTSTSLCTECTSPFVLYESVCLHSCPKSMFNSLNVCEDCPDYCSSCTSQDSCQTCYPGFTLSNSLCVEPEPVTPEIVSIIPSSSYQEVQEKATQSISSSAKGISSVVCVGSVVAPLATLVSKTVQNTRYLNLSVIDDLAEIYQTWKTDLISWEVPNGFSNEDHFESSPSLFTRYDIDSPFLVNFWPTLLNITIGFTIFIICVVLQKLFQQAKYEGWASSLLQKLVAGSFNFALVQAYACLDDILFYLVLDAKTNPFNSFFSWASIISAVIFFAIGCLLVFFNFWLVKKYQSIKKQGKKEIEAFNEKNKYWELLYSDFNDNDLWSQSFFATLIIRSTSSSFIITVLYDYPLLQTSFLLTLDGAIILFLFGKAPFNTLRGELAQYFYEIITLLVHMCAFVLNLQDRFQKSSDNVRLIFSTGIIYLNTGLIGGSLGFMFIEIYKTISEKKKEAKRKKAQNKCKDEIQSLKPSGSDTKKRQDWSIEKRNLDGNVTTYNLNVETSQVLESNFNAENSREVDIDASRINQHLDHTTTIFIRRKMRRLNPTQQENL